MSFDTPAQAGSNGEVEGPHRRIGQATRAHTVFQRPRSQTDHASRTPPTIVRRQRRQRHCPIELHICDESPRAIATHGNSDGSEGSCGPYLKPKGKRPLVSRGPTIWATSESYPPALCHCP
jgi:hypothetical protein